MQDAPAFVPRRRDHDRGPCRRGSGKLTGGRFLGIEPAGQRYEKPGTTVYRLAGGRLAESWGVEDTLGWFRQLGKYAD